MSNGVALGPSDRDRFRLRRDDAAVTPIRALVRQPGSSAWTVPQLDGRVRLQECLGSLLSVFLRKTIDLLGRVPWPRDLQLFIFATAANLVRRPDKRPRPIAMVCFGSRATFRSQPAQRKASVIFPRERRPVWRLPFPSAKYRCWIGAGFAYRNPQ